MRKKRESTEAGFTGDSGPRPRLTPIDVQQKEFRLAFRGYNERDVDGFLDMVTEEISAYMEEVERLRGQAGLGALASAGEGAADASREAEEILTRARAQAEAIVREAEERAASMLSGAGTAGVDLRALISPYLSREREFLQSLGQLVQEHAEAVRQMVRTTKEQAPAPVASPVAAEPPTPNQAEMTPSGEPEAAAPEVIRIESPDEIEPAERSERSLRELFWGEE